jgi:hypothetical protein
MATAKQILSNLYGLMMEINFHRDDDDVFEELHETPDLQIDNHLIQIKRIKAKVKAKANKARFQNALNEIKALKEKGIEELQKLFPQSERAKLAPLFRKFEELTPADEASILEDQELLFLLEVLKKRLDETSDD